MTSTTAERAPFLALIRRVASATDSQVLRILATVDFKNNQFTLPNDSFDLSHINF